MKAKTYKQLVMQIHDIESEIDANDAIHEIDESYGEGKITWKDHETLIDIICMIRVKAAGCRCGGVPLD